MIDKDHVTMITIRGCSIHLDIVYMSNNIPVEMFLYHSWQLLMTTNTIHIIKCVAVFSIKV